MAISLLRTKLYIPPLRPELVPRPRLIERLNAGLHRKLTLISAPAGFGKTTLLGEWVRHAERPVVWLSLDESDNDPALFLAYFVAAVQMIEANIGEGVLSAFQAPQVPPIESVLTALINQIVAVSVAFALVLDDYHLIAAELVHDAIAFLIDHVPGNMHLVIATRADPPLPLARLRAHGQLTELREADLRFSPDEAAAFLNQVMGLSLSDGDIAMLETRTEGWIAGLQLAALSMQGRDDVASFIKAFSGSHRYVIDYLAEEVLQRQTDEIRDFLRQTAILDGLTASLCDAVTGRDDSQDILLRLEQANLFVRPLDQMREWYRYHYLFADFLQMQIEPHHLASLYHRAAHWYEANGFMAKAVKYALATGDVSEAGRVIGLAAEDTLKNGQITMLVGWLDALPDEFVRASHELASYKSLALLLAGQLEGAESYLEAAESGLPADAPPARRAALVHLRASLALSRGDFGNTMELATEALDLIEDADPRLRSATLTILGRAQWLGGDLAAATQTYREVFRLSHPGSYLSTVSSLGDFASILHLQGRRREAAALCRRAIGQCVDTRGEPLPIGGIPHIALGMMCYEANELTQARRHLLTGIELCQQFPVTNQALIGKITLARLQQAMGEKEAAWETIQEACQMASQLPSGPAIGAMLAAAEAELRLKGGNVAAAVRWAEAADLSHTDHARPGQEPTYLTYARLLLARNRPRDAQTLLVKLADSAQKGGRFRSLITIRILQSLTHQALGHEEETLTCLEQALHLAAPEDCYRAFLDEGEPVARLLSRVRHVAPDFVGQLLESFGKEARRQVAPVPAQPLVEPLTERELEVLRLIATGRSNKEIAAELIVALSTVKKHINHIYGKLSVKSRTQAILRAQELGLL